MNSRFNLEAAVDTWRRTLEYNPALGAEDVAELVQHLRDQMSVLVGKGLGEEAAFQQALALMGDYASVEMEYRKVYWGTRRRQGELVHELFVRL